MNKTKTNRYIDLRINGRLFPSWVMANFKKFKIPEVFRKDDEDPCNPKQAQTMTVNAKKEMRIYQAFLTKFLDYKSIYRDMLIYHGVGSGKTASAVNIYNMLYNYTPGWNVFLLIKATLKDRPWMSDLQEWLGKEEYENRMKNVNFISYDSPIADKQFMDIVRSTDSSKKSLYIIDEAHRFIRNVYSNVSGGQGRRAQIIYDHIIQDKKENEGVRVLLLSGTPVINNPFELALLFNLLRPDIFPKSEVQFNNLYLTQSGTKILNPAMKNTFQRRILGLVSYHVGATPDYFAKLDTEFINLKMSEYQEDVYTYFESIEKKIVESLSKKIAKRSSLETYKPYTRQASNFVFPLINQDVTGELRPRPNKFNISDKESEYILEGRSNKISQEKGEKRLNIQKYMTALENFRKALDSYFASKQEEDKTNNYTILDDLKKFETEYKNDYNAFVSKEKKTSKLFQAMHTSSPKMTLIMFKIMQCKGPVLVYSNFVLMEGLDIFRFYLKYFGFSRFEDETKGKDNFRYMEYHGQISDKERTTNIDNFNKIENKYGKLAKVMMISPAGSEGISLSSIRQVHIMEPYWNEVIITQMIGRARRLCSHKYLPKDERQVTVYRYKCLRNKTSQITTDQYIENGAMSKEVTFKSFLDAMKEAAVDCELFKNDNMMEEKYNCFKFEEDSLFQEQIGPAYKEDIADDMKITNGLNNIKSNIVKIKVKKIKAIKLISRPYEEEEKYSEVNNYWYDSSSYTVYDYDLQFPVGKVGLDEDGIPMKKDEETYIITQVIPIPLIE
jgi:superfamily II DNA or RNA helicase